MTDSKKPMLTKLKTSSLDRRLSITKTSLNIGKRWAKNSISGLLMDKKSRQAHKQQFIQEQSQYLVEEIGKLKGSVVKIGQMMALYGEHLLPTEVTKALQSLNDNTASLAWSSIEPLIKQQLGNKINDLYIDSTPIGTASLAQVHRATIKSTGEQVVLKIQYPGVADAIDSDLRMLTQLLKVSNIVPQARAFDTWVAEIRDLLHREVNYPLEAQTTINFNQRLSGDERYIVPHIYSNYSSKQIICMSYEHGYNVSDQCLKQLSEKIRNLIGQSAIELILDEIFTWGEMQTDPNFGNYLVQLTDNELDINETTIIDVKPIEAKLVLLDFGAIRVFDQNLLNIARRLLIAGYNHDKEQMIAAMNGTNYLFFNEMSDSIKADMADVFLLATEPLANTAKLTHLSTELSLNCIDAEGRYIWSKSKLHDRLLKRARTAAKSLEFSVPPKEFMFISRKFIGAYTLLTTLNARTDANQLVKRFL